MLSALLCFPSDLTPLCFLYVCARLATDVMGEALFCLGYVVPVCMIS